MQTLLSDVFEDVDPPFFVRKVDRRTHWGSAEEILNNVFKVDDDNTISIWRIENSVDLERVAVALNANRVATNPAGASLHEPLHLLAIRPDDMGTIELRQVAGLTACPYANTRHFGAVIARDSQRDTLVNSLLGAGRKPSRLTKGKMKSAVASARNAGCRAVENDLPKCECGLD
jgi:hypothetical protein